MTNEQIITALQETKQTIVDNIESLPTYKLLSEQQDDNKLYNVKGHVTFFFDCCIALHKYVSEQDENGKQAVALGILNNDENNMAFCFDFDSLQLLLFESLKATCPPHIAEKTYLAPEHFISYETLPNNFEVDDSSFGIAIGDLTNNDEHFAGIIFVDNKDLITKIFEETNIKVMPYTGTNDIDGCIEFAIQFWNFIATNFNFLNAPITVTQNEPLDYSTLPVGIDALTNISEYVDYRIESLSNESRNKIDSTSKNLLSALHSYVSQTINYELIVQQNETLIEEHNIEIANLEDHIAYLKGRIEKAEIEYKKLKSQNNTPPTIDNKNQSNYDPKTALPYYLKNATTFTNDTSFFTEKELNFFKTNLSKVVKQLDIYCVPKVRIEDFICVDEKQFHNDLDLKIRREKLRNNAEYNASRSLIKSSHVDFLLLTKDTFIPTMVIELNNDSSHDPNSKDYTEFEKQKRRERDDFCKILYEKVGLEAKFYEKGKSAITHYSVLLEDIVRAFVKPNQPLTIKIPCADPNCTGHYVYRNKGGYGCSEFKPPNDNPANCRAYDYINNKPIPRQYNMYNSTEYLIDYALHSYLKGLQP